MTRLRSTNDLDEYLSQLDSLVCSLLADHTSMKCIDMSTSYEFIACPVRLLDERPLTYPIVNQVLRAFHEKYDGCSTKTLLFFLVRFYRYLRPFVDGRHRSSERRIFEQFEQIIDQSRCVTQQRFSHALSIDARVLQRICRYQTVYADSLYEAYVHFTASKSGVTQRDLIGQFDELQHITRVKYLEERCSFVPGTVLAGDLTVSGCRRTVLIDGHLLEDYVHIGYNNKMQLKSVGNEPSAWMDCLSSILQAFAIEVVLCSGTVDGRLKSKVECVENVSTRILRMLGERSIVNYLTDLNDESDVLLLNYVPHPDDSSMVMIDRGSTIIQYVPLERLVDLRHEQFRHCLARFRLILRENAFVDGSGEFERQLMQYWYEQRDHNSVAYEGFIQCLQELTRDVSSRKECFEANVIDDIHSKFDAWQTSLELVQILMQIDSVAEIVQNDQTSDL